GLAHLVEHLMFQTRPDGPDTPPLFQTIIDIANEFNAFTNWDMTHYFMTSRMENLDAMLKIEAMRMYYGCQNIPEAEFEREREVVRNEIRAQSSAEGQVFQHVEAAIYPKGHAYERMIGGNDEQIASATLEEACEFMKKYYAPERATLLVAGGINVDETVNLITKWFAKIPKRTPAPRVEVKPFVAEHVQKEIEADVERPAVWIGWALPPSNTEEGEYARFGIGSAFARIARASQEYEFAYSVEPAILGGQLAPLFLVRIELKGMGKLDEALEFAKKAAHQAYRGFDEGTYEELEEEKNREKASFIEGLERLSARTQTVADMVQFSKDFDFDSSDMYLFHELDKISKFDGGKVAKVVKSTLDWNKAAIVVVKPSTKGITGDKRSKVKFQANADAAFTDVPVDASEAKHPIKNAGTLKTFKAAQRFKLGNGMDVILLPIKAMPLAAAQLIFKNVGDASTPNSPALAAAAAEFLSLPMDAEAFARTGINVSCGTTSDVMMCRTHGVNIYLDVMLKGLERKVRAGVYNQESIESWQKSVRENYKLKSQQEETEYVRQVYTALFGPDHPYTKTAILTPEAAGKVGRDSLDSFRDSHYKAGNATLVVAGDFDPKYAEKLVRDVFGGWGTGTIDKPVTSTPYKRSGPAYVGVIKEKLDQQVTMTLAYPAPAGIDGQEAARKVLAEMLNIRAEDVRFKLGSTYGLYFARQPQIGPTSYMLRGGAVVGGTMDAERAGESIKALRDSLDALRAGDHFDEDFVRARRKILSQLLGESTVTVELAMKLGSIATYGLDTNFYNTLLQQVAAVSPAQVRALLKQELDPGSEVIVLLGDKSHVEKAFAGAGITDVKLVEPEYK
ncbi:MAG TPA: insulinase family protein, partial [Kofleriaceae bacterium]|nr:insulinase family protein [Kofleriaceae bacterium]